MELAELIPGGHENAIDRRTLSVRTGMPDRKIRKLIEEATRSGDIVVNLEGGYFRYMDESDLPYMELYYRREMARGWSIINKCRVIRKFLNRKKHRDMTAENQISIFDYMDRNV